MLSKKSNCNVAAKLRSLRAEHGYTQSDIAKRLQVSQQTYSNYEKDGSKIDIAVLGRICDLYGVSADYILGRDTQPTVETKIDQTLLIKDKAIIDIIADEVFTKIQNDQK